MKIAIKKLFKTNITKIYKYKALRELIYFVVLAIAIIGNGTTVGIASNFNNYKFIKNCNQSDKDTAVNWLLEEYKKTFPSIEGTSGNILGYWSERDILVELHSGNFAQGQQINDRYHAPIFQQIDFKKFQNMANKKFVMLIPADVVLLANSTSYEIIDIGQGPFQKLEWANGMNAFILALEASSGQNGIDQNHMKFFLSALSNYFSKLLQQLKSEGDPGENFVMAAKDNNPRLKFDENGKNAVKLIDKLLELLNSPMIEQKIIPLLQNLLWVATGPNSNNSSNTLIDAISQIDNINCFDAENSQSLKDAIKGAIKWANLAFHTEAQVIVLNAVEKFAPIKCPLVSLLNPCTSCFRLPFVFQMSYKKFFQFGLYDQFYKSYPINLLNDIRKDKNPKKKDINPTLARDFYNENKLLRLRPWIGPYQTGLADLKHSIKVFSQSDKDLINSSEAEEIALKKDQTTPPDDDDDDDDELITVGGTNITLKEVVVQGDGDCGYSAIAPAQTQNSREWAINKIREVINEDNEERTKCVEGIIAKEIMARSLEQDRGGPDILAMLNKSALAGNSDLDLIRNAAQFQDVDLLRDLLDNNFKLLIEEYLDHILKSGSPDDWMQFGVIGEHGSGIGDALAYSLGNNLVVVDGRRNGAIGNILHTYTCPGATETIYLIQSTDDHYNKGIVVVL